MNLKFTYVFTYIFSLILVHILAIWSFADGAISFVDFVLRKWRHPADILRKYRRYFFVLTCPLYYIYSMVVVYRCADELG